MVFLKIFTLLLTISNLAMAKITVVHNITGHTINNKELVKFEAIAFKDGKITQIGNSDELLSLHTDALLIDGQGRFILPGLHDSMSDVMQSALNTIQLDLTDTRSIEDVQKKIIAYAEQYPDKYWVQGFGWDHLKWEIPQLPTHDDLDAIKINKPIWLKSKNNKMGWANTKAMEITKAANYKTNPPGGEIIFKKDKIHSGIYIDYALNIIGPHIPDLTPHIKYQKLREKLLGMASLGITGIYESGFNYRTMVIYSALANNQDLPIRVNASITSSEKKLPLIIKKEAFHNEEQFLHIHGIKYFVDGDLDTHTAALFEPYTDNPQTSGRIKQAQEFLLENIQKNTDRFWQTNIHAVGDMANNIAINIISREQVDSKNLWNRIEKPTIIQNKDLKQLAHNNVVMTILPHAAIESFPHDQQKLGPKRSKTIHQWQSMIENGATIIAGSGFPEFSANPFWGIQAALTRKSHDGKTSLFFSNKQNLTREQALAAYTINAAYANRQEMSSGSLDVGKWADFILVDKNIMTAPVEELSQTQVLQTWVAGKKIYDVAEKTPERTKNLEKK